MDKKEYKKLEEQYRTLMEDDPDDLILEIGRELLDNNSFENLLTEDIARHIMQEQQQGYLQEHGGWDFWDSVSFKVDSVKHYVTAYGVSNDGSERPAILRMLFTVE